MLSAIGTGKTIEKAIEEALLELKASREDVDISILSEGGLFKKAKVEVRISEDAKEKYIKKDERRKADKVEVSEKQIVKEEKVEQPELKEEPKPKEKPAQQPKVEEKPKKEKAPRTEKQLDPMEFLQGFFKALKREVEITMLEDDKYVTYSIEGENLGDVIGRHGDGFYALTKLVQAACSRKDKRIILDVDGYRAKREQSLTSLALRTANKVAKSGRYLKLDPMNPSERRIIHTALQNDDRVTTLSKGTEPRRYVIIFPKEYKER